MTDTTSGGGTASTTNAYATAVEYVNAGLFVFPVTVTRDAAGKKTVRPHGEWRKGSSDRLTDVERWWGPDGTHRSAGILIDCGKSRLVVVDPDGQEGVANWVALNPPLPLWIARTPGGGEHWYYREHPDHPIGNDQSGKVAPHVDVRGLGGFVIAPPTHDGTGSWEWMADPNWVGDAVVPDVVIERMTKRIPDAPPATYAYTANKGSEQAFEDALFDDLKHERRFTRTQAEEFVRTELAKLKTVQSGFNGAINNFAIACAHFPWLIDEARCARTVQKHLGERLGWPDSDRNDLATIRSAYAATEAGRSWVAVEVPEDTRVDSESGGPQASGTHDDDTRPDILPPPSRPYDVARELLGWIPSEGGTPHRAWWRDDFYTWTGAHWEMWDSAEMERWLYRMTGDAAYLAPAKKEGEDPVRTPWAPTRKKVGDLAHALGVGVLQRTGEEDRVLAVANGVIRRRELLPHDPHRFNLFSLPFEYDPAATAPAWMAFLDQVLPGDTQAQDFLAEWFGYVISGRTDQQKMAALIGKKRSGKGTIARVLVGLIGQQNAAGLNLAHLSGTFGLEPLVGAALAVASDVRWQSRSIGDAIQTLLEVSGEDHVTAHRKNKAAWRGRMGVRFMLMSNDTPTFSDRSGALVDRMLYVSFRQSFLGREDAGLTDKLMHELPGILNWALDGLDRLDSRGRFTQPVSGQAEADATRRLADPIGAFLEDWCVIGPEQSIPLDHLFLKYQSWCESEGRTKDTTTKEIFSRDLRNKLDDALTSKRARRDGKFVTMLHGIGSDAL